MDIWFDQQTAGTIGRVIGTVIGCYGGVIGCLSNYCIKRNKKNLMYGLLIAGITAGILFLAAGLIALVVKQPYHVWYPLVLPGLLMVVLFAIMLPVMKGRFIQNEIRKMSAKDL